MNGNRNKIFHFGLSLCLAAGLAVSANGQHEPPKTPKPAKPAPTVKPRAEVPPVGYIAGFPGRQALTTERSIAVDPNVTLKLCVAEGRVKINGWDRDEVRVFVKNGNKFGVKVLEKNPDSGKANWVWIAGDQSGPARPGVSGECLSGETVEMDVPVNSTLAINGRSTQTTVDSVKKISIKNVEGSVALRNITGGITATALQGDLSVENSSGAISLDTTTGNIIAYEVAPGQIGDLFRAKTNSGAITLQKVDHRQIESSSITGSQVFDGKFLAGGLYNFKTSNGSIRLLIPDKTSATFEVTYGYGAFNSELPLKYVTENVMPDAKRVVATLGSGDASVKLTSSTGSIRIAKQEAKQEPNKNENKQLRDRKQ
jgi:hypothetical protein